MGGLCSRRSTGDNFPSRSVPRSNGHANHESHGYSLEGQTKLTPPSVVANMDKQLQEPFSFSDGITPGYGINSNQLSLEQGEPRLSRALSQKSKSTKAKPVAAGRIGTAKASSSSLFFLLAPIVCCFYLYLYFV